MSGGRAPQVSIASPDFKKITRIGPRATYIGNPSSGGVGKYFSLFWAFFSIVVFFSPVFSHTHKWGAYVPVLFSTFLIFVDCDKDLWWFGLAAVD